MGDFLLNNSEAKNIEQFVLFIENRILNLSNFRQ